MGPIKDDRFCTHAGFACNTTSLLPFLRYYSKLQPKFNKIRYDGSPDLPESQNSEMCILMKLDNKIDSTLLATVFYGQTFSTIDSECLDNINDRK